MKKKIIFTLTLMLLSIAALSQYQTVKDIPYVTSGNKYALERCKLDVYYPTDKKDVPVVVWFHGGGLEGGEKYIDAELMNAGYTVVAVNYRLLPKATIDEVIDDAAAAVAWTFKNIEKYNGSTKKIFLAGHSAGGYLIDMIGLNKTYLDKYGINADDVAAIVPFSGQVITHYNVRKLQNIPPLQATIDQYAPLTFIRKDAPPIVIISADRELELYGRYEEQAYFWRMLKLVGHQDVTLYEMQGYTHGNMRHPAYNILKETIKRLCHYNADASAADDPYAETATVNGINIWSLERTIYVQNGVKEIFIVDIAGQSVMTIRVDSDRMEIPMPKPGIYIVKTSAKTAKVMVK